MIVNNPHIQARFVEIFKGLPKDIQYKLVTTSYNDRTKLAWARRLSIGHLVESTEVDRINKGREW